MKGDSAAASVFVAVPPAQAFDVFTQEIDTWWRHGLKYRMARGEVPSRIIFECEPGGRVFEQLEERAYEIGKVVEWDPPARVSFEWRNSTFAEHEKTLVEVTFTPQRDGTMVRVVHSGWSDIRDDHPARHGKVGRELLRENGLWWGSLLTSLREHVASRN